jgi:CHASE1-domain containing sensor protein
MEVAAMSLSSHEQHALHSIEDRLCVSDPELASLLATFSRLTAGEDMPVREKTPASRVAARRSHRRRPAIRYRTWQLAGRPRRPWLWQAAGLALGLLVAVAAVAGAMAITGLQPGW